MSWKTKACLLACGLVAAATLPGAPLPAMAATMLEDSAVVSSPTATLDDQIQLAQWRRYDEDRYYRNDRRWRPYYRPRPPGYPRPPVYAPRPPAWVRPAPPPVYRQPPPGYAHVRWCLKRYRSYNPSTDQFLGYDGYYHYCRSPYR